jgi:hypothetical protein
MAVVVNEMEVMPAPAPKDMGSGAGSGGQSDKKPLDAAEVEHAVVRQMERHTRVRAH